MTNFQLIANAAIADGLYTREEIIAHLEERGELPLHTFAEWKNRGFTVRKGEHAKLTCQIWKPRTKKEAAPEDDGEKQSGFYLAKAFFFTEEQVEAEGVKM